MLVLHVLLLVAALLQKGDANTCYQPLTAADTILCSDPTCGGGSCTVANGCACNSDAAITCVPTTECATVANNICCPTGYYWSPTDKCCTATLICNPACTNDKICTNVSSEAICDCNTTLYSGQNSSSLSPIINCGSNVITVSLSECLLESIGYDSQSFQLNNNSDSCTNTYTQTINNQTMMTIQALPQTGWCGNVMTMDNTAVYYSNVLHIGISNTNVITANPVNLTFSCSYNLTIQTSLAGGYNTSTNTVNLTASGVGSVTTTMAAYWDAQYTQPIQSSDTVPVGSSIYIGVTANAGDVNTFVLRTERCVATPDNNVNNVNNAVILSGGCPANQGITAQVKDNGGSLESRFQFSSFAFQGQPLVYITCTVRLCNKNTTCTGCNAARDADTGLGVLQVPINFMDDYGNSASSTAVSWTLLTSSLVVFFSMKFF
ncbi:pancreatic secretory granule membrane major glycoprotein GP2-like [Rana temporaria]|uniref:pancreatic secretory granule membrane major glycoprotein GP2-like n=1 Tax=Rana temporaria TaxID=8407 RepID=UPI001AAD04C3|nr:pancreatic secretory granule membrane major glycoprotein GP2-like [Rana temporaria]